MQRGLARYGRQLGALAAAALALFLGASDAWAQDLADLPPPQDVGGPLVAGIGRAQPYWHGSGPHRTFVSGTFDLGVVYYRPTVAVGYGKPHYEWFGGELGSAISLSSSRLYGGLRGTLPGIDLRVGVRYESALVQHLLPPQQEFEREELETVDFPGSRYVAAEAELGTAIPVPGGSIIGVLSGYALFGELEGRYVFEETLKVVVAPPWLWRARLGYQAHIGWEGTMKLGGAAELLHVPNREAIIVRAGPIVSAALTHHLDVIGAIMLVAASPDTLGVVGADLGQLGLRYRWATGDLWSDFP